MLLAGLTRILAAVVLSCTALASSVATQDGENIVVPNDHPSIFYHGRWDRAPGTWWAGSGFKLNVEDLTSLTLNLGKNTTIPSTSIGVSLNYGSFVTVNVSEGANVIPLSDISEESTSKSPRSTVVRITTEGWQNNRMNLESLELNPGAKLQEYTPSKLTFQIIGDSLSAGQYLDQGVLQAWPTLTAEFFKAELLVNAQPGAALKARSEVSSYGSCLLTWSHAPTFLRTGYPRMGKCARDELRILPSDLTEDTGYYYTTDHNYTTPWDFGRDEPAATHVVIHIGANDASQNVTATDFEQTYLSFVSRLRTIYHEQPIFVFTPWGWPNPDGTISQYYPGSYERIVQARHALGDENVFLVNTTGWVTYADVFPSWVFTAPNEHETDAIIQTLYRARNCVDILTIESSRAYHKAVAGHLRELEKACRPGLGPIQSSTANCFPGSMQATQIALMDLDRRRRHNASLPVSKLPAETLLEVFKESPLHVGIDLVGTSSNLSVFNRVIAELPRIENLDLHGALGFPWPQRPASSLKSLTLYGVASGQINNSLETVTAPFSHSLKRNFPVLRHLSISYHRFDFTNWVLPSTLTRLRVHGHLSPTSSSFNDILLALQNLPQLQELMLINVLPKDALKTAGKPLDPVSLPFLRSFVLHGHMSASLDLLHHVRLPTKLIPDVKLYARRHEDLVDHTPFSHLVPAELQLRTIAFAFHDSITLEGHNFMFRGWRDVFYPEDFAEQIDTLQNENSDVNLSVIVEWDFAYSTSLAPLERLLADLPLSKAEMLYYGCEQWKEQRLWPRGAVERMKNLHTLWVVGPPEGDTDFHSAPCLTWLFDEDEHSVEVLFPALRVMYLDSVDFQRGFLRRFLKAIRKRQGRARIDKLVLRKCYNLVTGDVDALREHIDVDWDASVHVDASSEESGSEE
ncbi:hypothetical protein NM688_g6041 [Phlebia brevispora]|uniref:Uncharacterized protein n=1 Tax=Phlebia brevispora TaxID=194682 RepID=A0ACC1SKK8_9APHY|nr:hypothetical protein NM688_g6041 [Phlebia brevispora]